MSDPIQKIAKRFTRDTAQHQMIIAHDDGLYRHLQFRHTGPNYSGYCWFDLITVPGALIFQGDGDSFVFRRLEDMFEFFRMSAYNELNPQYWAEKLTSGHDSVMLYDRYLLTANVKDDIAHYYERSTIPDGLNDAVQEHILDELTGDESLDRARVDKFTFYKNPDDRYAVPHKDPDFQFSYADHWNVRDYHWWYLWACHAIVWGITQYDAHHTATVGATNG